MTAPEPILFFRRCLVTVIAGILTSLISGAALADTEKAVEAPKAVDVKEAAKPEKEAKPTAEGEKTAPAEVTPVEEPAATVDPDDEVAVEKQEVQMAAVARPVMADPVQVYGWREHIYIKDVEEKIQAKLDTGAFTSSIHAEEKELFERDGKKWVRFIVTDPSLKKPVRTRLEAPLVRIARIKEPGGESTPREVVQLSFTIGERKMRGEFTLNNRSNMLAPVLIGRNTIKELGWIDSGRTYLADEKIFR